MKQPRSLIRPTLALIACGSALTLALAGSRAQAANPVPPPPIPIGPTSPPTTAPGADPNATPLPSALPTATASPAGRGRRRGTPAPASTPAPEPSSTPTSPAFATLDGSWEVQLQYIDHTEYSYLDITQTPAGALAGKWRVNGKSYPFTGSYDGRTFNLSVAGPKGTMTWAGYVEAASDMVGLVDAGDGKTDKTAFTAEHRASPKNPFKRDSPEPSKSGR